MALSAAEPLLNHSAAQKEADRKEADDKLQRWLGVPGSHDIVEIKLFELLISHKKKNPYKTGGDP